MASKGQMGLVLGRLGGGVAVNLALEIGER